METLREIGKLQTKVGNTILAAAIIDDILGLIALTIATSLGGADVNVWIVLLKIVLFFLFVAALWFWRYPGLQLVCRPINTIKICIVTPLRPLCSVW